MKTITQTMNVTLIFLALLWVTPLSTQVTMQSVTAPIARFVLAENEVLPSFPGGNEAMFSFIGTNLKYPEKCKKEGIEGKAFVSFLVDENGSLSNYKVLKADHNLFGDAAVEVIQKMPNWNPGLKDGKPAKMEITLPFVFKLAKNQKGKN